MSKKKNELPPKKLSENKSLTTSLQTYTTSHKNLLLLGLGIFVLALVVRFIYITEEQSSPFYMVKGTDASIYDSRANGLLKGTWPGESPFELRPPGYPVFVAGVYTLAGNNPNAVKYVQLFLGALACLLVFLIARSLFSGTKIPLTAALFCIFNGVLIFYETHLLSGSIDVFFTLLVLFLFLKAGRDQRVFILILAGVCLGFSVINRGWMLLFLPFGLLWIYFSPQWLLQLQSSETNQNKSSSTSQKILQLSIVFIAAMLPLLPVMWQNAKYDLSFDERTETSQSTFEAVKRLLQGDSSLLASGNINLYIGNHKDWKTFNDASVEDAGHFVDFQRLRDEPLKYGIKSSGAKNQYFKEKAVETILEDPSMWFSLMARKMFQYFNGNEIPRAVTIYPYRDHSFLLSGLVWKWGIAFPSGLLIPLGLIGVFLSLSSLSWKKQFPVIAALAIHFGFVMLFFVTSRYRLAALPLFSIYAAFTVWKLVDFYKTAQFKKFYSFATVAVLFIVLSNINIGTMQDHSSHEYNMLATHLYKKNDYKAATHYYKKALAVDPKHSESHGNLGLIYQAQGSKDLAIAHYIKAIDLNPDYVDAYHSLGTIYLNDGRIDEAITNLEKSLELAPGKWDTHLNLLVVYFRQNKLNLAVKHGLKAVEIKPNDYQIHYNLSRVLMAGSNLGKALFHMKESYRLNPSNSRAKEWIEKLENALRG